MQRQRYMFYSVCSCQHEIKCSSSDGMEFIVVSRTLALAAILRLIPKLIHPEVSNLMPLFFTLSRLMKKKSKKLQQKSQLSAPSSSSINVNVLLCVRSRLVAKMLIHWKNIYLRRARRDDAECCCFDEPATRRGDEKNFNLKLFFPSTKDDKTRTNHRLWRSLNEKNMDKKIIRNTAKSQKELLDVFQTYTLDEFLIWLVAYVMT